MDSCWIFAHPDDEAFGPGLAMAALAARGHAVHLLTLTRGGASRLRDALGLTRRELEALRESELRAAARELGCASLSVGDFPDGGLVDCDRRALVDWIGQHLARLAPQLVVTLPPHGINGHLDHCLTSATVTQAWSESDEPGRLAYIQLPRAVAEDWAHGTHGIEPDQADVRIAIDADLRERGRRALACHRSQTEVIAEHRPLDRLGEELLFQTVREHHDPPLHDLLAGL